MSAELSRSRAIFQEMNVNRSIADQTIVAFFKRWCVNRPIVTEALRKLRQSRIEQSALRSIYALLDLNSFRERGSAQLWADALDKWIASNASSDARA